MQMTFDLSQRQASRVLEQALRTQTELSIEPRSWGGEPALTGVLQNRQGRLLGIRIGPRNSTRPLNELMGSFCDISMQMSGDHYLFTSCVLDASDAESGLLFFSQPEAIHVANRRNYERTNVHIASQVRICPAGQSVASVGLMTNISPTGLACSVPGLELEEALCVGDSLRVVFELAGASGNFNLNAQVCDKRVRRESQQLELGLSFAVDANDQAGLQTLQRLRRFLAQLFVDFTKSDGDA